MTRYRISFRSYGSKSIIWESEDFNYLSYRLNADDVTEVEFEPLTGVDLPRAVFNKMALMQIWRSPWGAADYALEGGTEWMVVRCTVEYDDEGVRRVRIAASHPNLVLQKRLVAYPSETTQAEKTQDMGSDAPVVTLLEQFMRENVGDLAEVGRSIPSLRMTSIPAVLPAVEVSAPWRNLLSTLQELARQEDVNGERCYFSLTEREDVFDFRIMRGALGRDLTDRVVFGYEHGNLSSLTITDDYGREVNTIYVGGEGQGLDQIVAMRQSGGAGTNPAFRWEDFLQAGYYVDSDSAMQSEGDRYLAANGARRGVKAQAIDSSPHVYGMDFNHGDRVTLRAEGASYSCVIYAVAVTVEDALEKIELYLETEVAL